ncbi:MAG TPA: aldehyde dehydrogenase family protein [Jatrophihabitans sp.]
MSVWSDLPLLIGGRLVEGRGAAIEVENPAAEERIATVGTAAPEQVDAAVAAARAAFERGPWAGATPADRAAMIDGFADAFDKNVEAFTEAIIDEVGTPIAVARPLQVQWPAGHLRWYAQQAAVDRTEQLGEHLDPVRSYSEVAYRPIGVVAAVTAYNYPLTLAVHKLGAALAAGCTVVLMPSPRTPVATLLLARAIADSSLPPGVVNIIVGGADVGRALTSHPDVDKVTFTGSAEVGAHVMRQAAANLNGVVLELGGKSPAILTADADLAAHVPALHLRYSRNGGQACAAPTRLLVPRQRWAEFVDLSRETYERQLVVGDPRDPATVVGPMIDAAHRTRVEKYVADAVAQGAAVVAGGGRPEASRGHYVNPVLLADVDNSWPVAQEEIFGPVAVALPYDDIDDALRIANATRYGLHAYVYTADVEQGRTLAARLRAGSVSINGGGGFRPDAPMGGFGISGIGREVGRWGIHEFLEPQHVQWPLG